MNNLSRQVLSGRRGYALPLVLVVLLLMTAAFGGLLTTISGVSASMGATLRQRKVRLECQGLARVTGAAIAEMVASGTATRAAIDAKLGLIRWGAWRDRIRGVEIEASIRDTGTVSFIGSGPLQGLPFIERLISTRLRLEQDSDSCRALTEQPIASFAITQFSSLAGETFNAGPSNLLQRCDLSTASMTAVPAPPGYLPTPLTRAVAFNTFATHPALTGSGVCPDVSYAAGPGVPEPTPLELPFMPSSMGFRAAQDETNNPFTVRPQDLAALGASGQEILEATQRNLPLQADIRILNGVWYKGRPDLSIEWPGTQIWSDRFDQSSISATGPRQYSEYERSNGDAALGVPAGRMLVGNRGVVSYGSRHWGAQAARNELCDAMTGPCNLRGNVVAHEAPDVMLERVTRINMTRVGFNAPGFQFANNWVTNSDTTTSRVTPINLDLGFLATAFNSTTNGELGTHFCLTTGCAGRMWNGILYVNNAEREYLWAEYGARVAPPVGNNRSQGGGLMNHVATPLWAPGAFWSAVASLEYGTAPLFSAGAGHSGPTMGITDEVVFRTGPGVAAEGNGGFGYNAVRITNAADLTAFRDTGFTLITALPVFIEGDFNTATVGGERPAALIVTPFLYVSTPNVDPYLPTSGTAFVSPMAGIPVAPRLRVYASVLRSYRTPMGVPAGYNSERDLLGSVSYAATELLCSLNPDAIIELHGAIATLPTMVRNEYNVALNYQPGARVEQHYPLELGTATVRTETDRRLPPGTPRVSFVQGSIIVN